MKPVWWSPRGPLQSPPPPTAQIHQCCCCSARASASESLRAIVALHATHMHTHRESHLLGSPGGLYRRPMPLGTMADAGGGGASTQIHTFTHSLTTACRSTIRARVSRSLNAIGAGCRRACCSSGGSGSCCSSGSDSSSCSCCHWLGWHSDDDVGGTRAARREWSAAKLNGRH